MSDELKSLRDDMVQQLRTIIRDGVDNVGPDGKIAGKKIAPASYFAVAAKLCHAAGITATDSQAGDLAAQIAASTGTKFEPKLVDDEEAA